MRAITLLATALLVACGGSSATATGPSLVGVYQLNTVNGSALPVVIAQGDGVMTYLTGEVLTVSLGGTYQTNGAESRKNASGYGTSFAMSSTGTYVASGSNYTFTDVSLGVGIASFSASIAGSTLLTVSLAGVTYVFTKQ